MEEERSTAVEVQQDECEDYAVDVTTASSWYKNVSYDDAKIFIRTNIESAARSFIAIGYYLKLIRDGELYREEGHENIWDFAMAEYGISKSTASRYMSMNDRFSLDGNSPIVDQKYKDFEKSKLQEMLSLTDEQLEQVTPEMKVQEIRAMRQPKEIPYFELEGQLDFETDFPEVFPEVPAVAQPATIQTTMTLEEMMGGEELGESDEQPEVVATSQQETSSMVLETAAQSAANNQESATEEQQDDINQMESETAGVTEEPPEYDREQLEHMIWVQEQQLECMGTDWKQNEPAVYTKHCMMLQAYKLLLLTRNEEEPTTQPELPHMKNNDQRKEWLRNYKPWGIWYRDEHIGSTFYKYDFECGARLVVEEFVSKYDHGDFTHAKYHLIGGPEPPKDSYRFSKWARHEEYNHYPNSDTELVEFLKYIQKEA